MEQILQGCVAEINAVQVGCVGMRGASSVTALETAPDGAPTITVQTVQDSSCIRANWLVVCNGRQRLVCKSLGLALSDTAYKGHHLIIDSELPSTAPTERSAAPRQI